MDKMISCICIGAVWLGFAIDGARGQTPVGTTFTYQGRLTRTGQPVSDTCEFVFTLWDAATKGRQVGPTVRFDADPRTPDPLRVRAGLFTVSLDFGSGAMNGQQRWLEIEVRCPVKARDSVVLRPRQPLTAVPYALHALSGGSGGGDGHSLDAADGSPANAVFVDEEGRVGVGTTTPLTRLQIQGPDHATDGPVLRLQGTTFDQVESGRIRLTESNFIGGYIHYDGLANLFHIGVHNTSSIDPANDNNALTIQRTTGNVGIGTDTPAERLSVDGLVASTAGFKFPDGSIQSTAALGGAGDGHSLDAADGSPIDALVVDTIGNVGIGTPAPMSRLHLAGLGGVTLTVEADTNNAGGEDQNARILLSQDGGIVTGRVGYRHALNKLEMVNEFDDSLILGTDNLDRVTITSAGDVGIGTSDPDARLHVDGTFDVAGGGGNVSGGHVTIGSLNTFNMVFDGNEIQARVAAGASDLFLNDRGGRVRIAGGETGDDAVVLPPDAVSAFETLDEPGLASRTQSGLVTLTDAVKTLTSRTIDCPADGYVIATATVTLFNTNPLASGEAELILSKSSTTWPSSAEHFTVFKSFLTTTIHNVFSVSAGTITIYFLANDGKGSTNGMRLTLVYIPTAYGTVHAD